jgi:hypothetical protein
MVRRPGSLMAKGFNRPSTIDVKAQPAFNTPVDVQRNIRMPREDSGVEGLYDRHILREPVIRDASELKSDQALYRVIRGWVLFMLFWLFVLFPIAAWLWR